MRLFVAAALDVQIRESVGDAIEICRQQADLSSRSIKWIELANVHLTLAFLGEVTPEAATEVQAMIGRPWKQPAFWVGLSGAGAFPPAGPPRVIWLGFGAGGAELRTLHAEVETRLEPLGLRTGAPSLPRAPDHRPRQTGHAGRGCADSPRAAGHEASADAVARRPRGLVREPALGGRGLLPCAYPHDPEAY